MADPRRRRRRPVKEITDARIGEYSGVDKPATDRDWVMFKRDGSKKDDFPGIGSNTSGTMPTGGEARDLVDLQSCLQAHPDWSPAQCEAAAAGEGIELALEAEMEGDDATVSDPPTAGTFELAKPDQRKPADVDECVQGLLSDPEFSAGDFEDREQRAFAICQSQAARLGGPKMPGKQDPMAEEIIIEGEPSVQPTVEVATTAIEWPMEQCIAEAKETLGTDDDGALAVCSIIRTDFGDLENPAQILIPDTMTTEGLLTSAAITAGIVKGGSGGGEGSPEEGKSITFIGRNRWQRWMKAAAGLLRPKTPEQKAVDRLRQEVTELKQEKSKDRLIQTLLAQNRMFARAAGMETSDLDSLAEAFGLGPSPAAPAAEPNDPLPTAVELLAEAKRRKDVLEGGEAIQPPKPLAEMSKEELEAEIIRLNALLGDPAESTPATPAAPAPVEEAPVAAPVAAPLVVVAGSPAAMGVTTNDDDAPPEGIALIDPALAVEPAGKTAIPAQRKSVAPVRGAGQVALKKSSILGGAYLAADSRKAVGWKRGV